ncbi:MAG: type II toxin-antitoxin system Phd/YefM family antitoxin [Ruminiclostridium sp.]
MGVVIEKPVITKEQMVKSSIAAKNFGALRKKAKAMPQYITDNGTIDTVLLDYNYYEEMYERLVELEAKEEAKVLEQRIERLNTNPEMAVSWKSVRRTVKEDDR